MRILVCLSLVSASSLLLIDNPVSAQVVQVAPGYVRAPFVRVERGPDGSTRVRAPFVDVESNRYRHVGPHGHPTNPYGYRFDPRTGSYKPYPWASQRVGGAEQPIQGQRRLVASAALELEQALARITNGSYWAEYLRLPDSVFAQAIGPRNRRENTLAPTPQELDSLNVALDRFRTTAETAEYAMISRLPAFQVTHRRLAEFVALIGARTPATPTPVAPLPPAEEILPPLELE